MNSILFSSQKPTNGKKRKSHKMFVFAQDIGIRNLVKILPVSTTLRSRPPFSTAKKTWSKVLPILLVKCNPKSNAYPWKIRMPKSNHYILKYEDWKFGQGNASIRTYINPPFAFPIPKEKHKYISASALAGPASARKHACVLADALGIAWMQLVCAWMEFYCARTW
jgi:hypothetical protein